MEAANAEWQCRHREPQRKPLGKSCLTFSGKESNLFIDAPAGGLGKLAICRNLFGAPFNPFQPFA